MRVETGARGEARLVVGPEDTAAAFGSGDVPVLATPKMVALVEQACVKAVNGCCAEDETTVGMKVMVDHLQPSRIGVEVVAEAVLEKVEGRRLTFTVSVSDPGGLVAAGRIVRVLVSRHRFLDKAGVVAT